MEKIDKQPLDKRTLGCVFKNPLDTDLSSGKLIQDAGLKGASIGKAQVSEKHANFIVNEKQATAKDVVVLINLVRDKVKEKTGVLLETEVKILGVDT